MTVRLFNEDFILSKRNSLVFLNHPKYSLVGSGKDLHKAGIDLEYEGRTAKQAMMNNRNPKYAEYKKYLLGNF
jgi:hypothetical protein